MTDSRKVCECCDTAREYPEYSIFCPSCIYCGARMIWRIQRMPRGVTETAERCRRVLRDWMNWGHAEVEIRRLAKLASAPVRPPPEKKKGR